MITETNFTGIGVPKRGKVRDVYDLGDYLLLVATDRISAFDVVLPDPIPKKGQTLNGISELWFKKLWNIPNHFLTCDTDIYPDVCIPYAEKLKGRSMLVRKAQPLPVECIVRGYISGSAWESYQKSGTVCGIKLPPGLIESQKLPTPILTPSTKAEAGEHDENISYDQMTAIVGGIRSAIIKTRSLRLYEQAQELAEQAGVIIADTKFEFGLDENGGLIVIDEILTPDSSRFWPADTYKPGGPQPSFDKQFVRDYLKSIGWNKKPPAPKLPEAVIKKTTEKYLEAHKRLKKVLA
ncbi:phosphoribosylaminoimidazolesuccinocarboxamide synthase [Candidatus Falkowbacteria bacterium]|nr:phosphoribosylaminoimidazolesuccinocarboxamide synthase [Candidatus Falkowbacteria bacterium]